VVEDGEVGREFMERLAMYEESWVGFAGFLGGGW